MNVVLLRFGEVNRNGRIYTREGLTNLGGLVRKSVDGRLYGEFEVHPDPNVTLRNVSHIVTGLRFVGDCLVGDVKVLETERGRALRAFTEGGAEVSFVPRTVGTVGADGTVRGRITAFDVAVGPDGEFFVPVGPVLDEDGLVRTDAIREMEEEYRRLILGGGR